MVLPPRAVNRMTQLHMQHVLSQQCGNAVTTQHEQHNIDTVDTGSQSITLAIELRIDKLYTIRQH